MTEPFGGYGWKNCYVDLPGPLLSRNDILALGIAGKGVERDASAGLEPLILVVLAMLN